MVDVLTPAQRHLNMSRIRGADTGPELTLRRALHAGGFRYVLHSKKLPGRPDLAFPRFRAVVYINGCFWHGHDCALFTMPKTRTEFWEAKIEGNRARDARTLVKMSDAQWRCLTVWECALRGPNRRPLVSIVESCMRFLRSGELTGVIEGSRW